MVLVRGAGDGRLLHRPGRLRRIGLHLGDQLEVRRVIGVAAAGLQAGALHGRLEVKFMRRAAGDRGRREAIAEGPGADDAGRVDAERPRIAGTGFRGFGSVQRVMDGSPFRPAGKRHLRLVREKDQVSMDRGRTDERLRREGIRRRQVLPFRHRLCGKGERQLATAHDFVIGEPVPVHRLTVQFHAGDVGLAGIVRLDGQGLAIRKPDN